MYYFPFLSSLLILKHALLDVVVFPLSFSLRIASNNSICIIISYYFPEARSVIT